MTITKDNSNLFAVGQIVGFRALKGEVKIRLLTNNPRLLDNVDEAQIHLTDGSIVMVTIDKMQILGNTLIVSFVEYPTRTEAEVLQNGQVFVAREDLSELTEDEWWFADLVGLSAYTQEGKLVGTVFGIIDGITPVIEIKPINDDSGKMILVPFVKALVPVVDLKNKRIEVSDLPGLLDAQ